MIHILLLILKIIGIVLLTLLGIVLLVLFVPISYVGVLRCNKEKGFGNITMGWLFHILHFKWNFDGKSVFYCFRIFGIPIISSKKKDRKSGKTKEKKSRGTNIITIKNTMSDQEEVKIENQTIEKQRTEDSRTEKQIEKNSNQSKEKGLTHRIKVFFQNIKNKIVNITHNIKKSSDKLREIKKFVCSENTKAAWKYGKNIITKCLKHILPGKIRGNVRIGFDEPHITGETLGYIAIIFGTFGINPKHIVIEPDFEKKVLAGQIKCKGHILLAVIGIYALKFYFNKDIHDIIKKIS